MARNATFSLKTALWSFCTNRHKVLYYTALFFMIFCSTSLWSQTTVQSGIWKIGGSAEDEAWAIHQTKDGGFITAGDTKSFGVEGSDFYIIKLDAFGNRTWSKTIGGQSADYGSNIQQTYDGGYVFVGSTYSSSEGKSDGYVAKLDSLGNIIWQKTVGGPFYDFFVDVKQTPDSGYVIVGETESYGDYGQECYIVRISKTGNLIWTRAVGGHGNDVVDCIQLTSDGNYVMTGATSSFGAGGFDTYTIKMDTSGNVIWATTVGDSLTDAAYQIHETSDGGFILTGDHNYKFSNPTNYGVYIVKLNQDGHLVWAKTKDKIGGAYSNQIMDDGSILMLSMKVISNVEDLILMKFDSSGSYLWSKEIGGTNNFYANDMHLTHNGGIIISGYTISNDTNVNYDVLVLKLDSLGNGCNSVSRNDTFVSSGIEGTGGEVDSGGIINNALNIDANNIIDTFVTLCQSLTINHVQIHPIRCHDGQNGEITISVVGGTPPYNYSWHPQVGADSSISNIVAGSYIVTVTDADSNRVKDTIDLSNPPPINLNVTAHGDTLWSQQDSAAYQWLDCQSGLNPIFGATNQYYVTSSANEAYAVAITVDACTATTFCRGITGIPILSDFPIIKLFPIPTDGDLFIQSSQKIKYLYVENIMGEKVLEASPRKSQIKLSLGGLSNGVYYVTMIFENHLVTKKIVIEK